MYYGYNVSFLVANSCWFERISKEKSNDTPVHSNGKPNYILFLYVEIEFFRYNIATGSYEDRCLFKKINFHYSVFDEGHMLKNMVSQRYRNLMKIKVTFQL